MFESNWNDEWYDPHAQQSEELQKKVRKQVQEYVRLPLINMKNTCVFDKIEYLERFEMLGLPKDEKNLRDDQRQ